MPEKDTQKYRQRLWKIFLSTLYLSAFTFGGGYVIVTLMKKKFVDEYHWIGEDEMLDLVAIASPLPVRSQSTELSWWGTSWPESRGHWWRSWERSCPLLLSFL